MTEFFTTPLGTTLIILGQCLLMAVFLLLSAYFILYADRKIWAAVQMRRGPNVVGAFGLLQSLADMLKLVLKEIVVPAGADRTVFFIAPVVSFALAMLAWAVIPLNEGWAIADVNVAILFVFAVSSL
ncbi:MAG: NADH-quinone oxidoreductase subunit H, partial [Pseudomonadota bacterium]